MERELSNPPPVSDQRTLFLVNTFVIHTVRHLNNFAVICEDKLANVHRRILRADATLTLLEAKLKSVDELGVTGQQITVDDLHNLAHPPTPQSSEAEHLVPSHFEPSSSPAKPQLSRGNSIAVTPRGHSQLLKVQDDRKYAHFFRMLQVGVPLGAVKIQMSLEGIDGSLLENPDAPSPIS